MGLPRWSSTWTPWGRKAITSPCNRLPATAKRRLCSRLRKRRRRRRCPAAPRRCRRAAPPLRQSRDLCGRRNQSPRRHLRRDGCSPAGPAHAADVPRAHERRQNPPLGRHLVGGPKIAAVCQRRLSLGGAVHQLLPRSLARQRIAQLPAKVPRRRLAADRRPAISRGQAGYAGRTAAHGRTPSSAKDGSLFSPPTARRPNCPSWVRN